MDYFRNKLVSLYTYLPTPPSHRSNKDEATRAHAEVESHLRTRTFELEEELQQYRDNDLLYLESTEVDPFTYQHAPYPISGSLFDELEQVQESEHALLVETLSKKNSDLTDRLQTFVESEERLSSELEESRASNDRLRCDLEMAWATSEEMRRAVILLTSQKARLMESSSTTGDMESVTAVSTSSSFLDLVPDQSSVSPATGFGTLLTPQDTPSRS